MNTKGNTKGNIKLLQSVKFSKSSANKMLGEQREKFLYWWSQERSYLADSKGRL